MGLTYGIVRLRLQSKLRLQDSSATAQLAPELVELLRLSVTFWDLEAVDLGGYAHDPLVYVETGYVVGLETGAALL